MEKKSITPRTDLYLHKSKKEEIIKKNANYSKMIRIKNQDIRNIYQGKDELISHFEWRQELVEKMKKPKNRKEWNRMNSLSECYANEKLLQVSYSPSVQEDIQQILQIKK